MFYTGDIEKMPRLVGPGDSAWDEARGAFNLLIDQQPEAIAFPTNEREVASAVAFARRQGWRVAPQSTGHNAGPLGSLEGTLIVNTSELGGIKIDTGARRVRVGTATRWRDLTPKLSELGFAALHGSSPEVGIAGYSLGGGVGWLARKLGMQTNAVTAIELVTAEGHHVRTDAVHEPDLFWGLRGGGGNFGVVTAIEFEIFPVTELYAGAMFFEIDRAQEVFQTWVELLPSLPEEMTSWANVINFPPLPEIPEPLRGRRYAIVMAAFLGEEAEGHGLLTPIRELDPVMDTFAMQPPIGLSELAMDPTDPLPIHTGHALAEMMPAASIADMVEIAGEGSALDMLQLRHMGGALGRSEASSGVRSTLPGELCVFALGVSPDPEHGLEVRDQISSISELAAPHVVGHYPNFIEEPADPSAFFDPESWQRLREIKALYDPGDMFKANHHIPPAA